MKLSFAIIGFSAFLLVLDVQADRLEEGMAAFEVRKYQQALSLWQALADEGNVAAKLNIGEMYAKGLGVSQDIDRALEYFRSAAMQGSGEAEFRLGELYASGRGQPVDFATAVKWYRKAARRGHAKAQYRLGVRYFKGEGVPTDYVTAYAWMDVATKQGHPTSSRSRDMIGSVLHPDELKEARTLAAQLSKKHGKTAE